MNAEGIGLHNRDLLDAFDIAARITGSEATADRLKGLTVKGTSRTR
jgi:hypothetical protein